MTVEQAAGMRDGEYDMGLTNCRDPYDSPFAPAASPATSPRRCA